MSLKNLFLVFFVFSLMGCNFSDISAEPDYCRMAHRIMDQFIKDVRKEPHLRNYGDGGAFCKQVEKFFLSFETVGPLSQDELRVLMITVAEEFLERINKDEEIRPYLLNYPFQPENLKFRIRLFDTKFKPIKNKGSSKALLYSVLLINGELVYDISNEEISGLQDVHEEPYSEALEIVKKERPDLFKGK